MIDHDNIVVNDCGVKDINALCEYTVRHPGRSNYTKYVYGDDEAECCNGTSFYHALCRQYYAFQEEVLRNRDRGQILRGLNHRVYLIMKEHVGVESVFVNMHENPLCLQFKVIDSDLLLQWYLKFDDSRENWT